MTLPVLTTTQIVLLIALAVLSGCAWMWLRHRRAQDIEPTALDTVLKVVGLPLVLGAGALVLFAGSGGTGEPVRREGDDDLEPDEPVDTPPRETEGEHVRRVIEKEADRVETHVRDKATDDEVAARGAAIFDPGVPDKQDEAEED